MHDGRFQEIVIDVIDNFKGDAIELRTGEIDFACLKDYC
jgi:hypothetical protein